MKESTVSTWTITYEVVQAVVEFPEVLDPVGGNLIPSSVRQTFQSVEVFDATKEHKEDDWLGLGVGIDLVQEFSHNPIVAASSLESKEEVILISAGH